MFDFQKIIELRDGLIESLKSWRSPTDGFYKSAPTVAPHSSPSFTNTGIVLQAFNESGKTDIAQLLADRLIEYLRTNNYNPFPHEKAEKGDPKSHILCNAWPIFAILDCYPTRVEEFRKICEWFLNSQEDIDGRWDLLPGEETKYPIFTAYALSAILQFYDCYKKINSSDKDYLRRLERSLEKGFSYLFINRAYPAAIHDLLLWPASLNDVERNPVSFSTSAICMHMIAKASVLLQKDEWTRSVEKTLLHIVDKFDLQNDGNFKLGEMEVNMWDQIHVNESSLNYSFTFFSPISLTTFLRFTASAQFINNGKYYYFIKNLTEWILSNKSDIDGRIGIKGSKFITDIKTWSTAQSVIVLSRIIRKGYTLSNLSTKYGQLATEYESLSQDYNKIKTAHESASYYLRQFKEILSINGIHGTIRRATTFGFIVVACFTGYIIYYILSEKIQSKWPQIAGKAWLAGMIITAVLTIIGFSWWKLRKSIIKIFSNLIIRLIQIKRLNKIMNTGTFSNEKKNAD